MVTSDRMEVCLKGTTLHYKHEILCYMVTKEVKYNMSFALSLIDKKAPQASEYASPQLLSMSAQQDHNT